VAHHDAQLSGFRPTVRAPVFTDISGARRGMFPSLAHHTSIPNYQGHSALMPAMPCDVQKETCAM
jgi:hypothetical protein